MTFQDRMAKMAAKQLQAEQRRVYNRKWRAEHALRIATEEEAELKEFAQALANASEDGVAPEFARAEARIERTMAKSKRLFDEAEGLLKQARQDKERVVSCWPWYQDRPVIRSV